MLPLYTKNEPSKTEIKKAILVTIASKRIKYVKEMHNLHTENYKTLSKEIEDLN